MSASGAVLYLLILWEALSLVAIAGLQFILVKGNRTSKNAKITDVWLASIGHLKRGAWVTLRC